MSNTIVLTHSDKYNCNVMVTFEDGRALVISRIDEPEGPVVGDIYLGRVKNIVKNINAAFIEVAEGEVCYYEPETGFEPIFVSRQSPNKMCEGDAVLVQVTKEAHSSKQACVSGNLSFASKYVVLTSGNKRISMSSKLSMEDRNRLDSLVSPYKDGDFGLILRTNAGNATDEDIISQINDLQKELEDILSRSAHKAPFMLLKKGEPDYIDEILGLYDTEDVKEIITDIPDYFQCIKDFASLKRPEFVEITKLYEESDRSLNKKFDVDYCIEKALSDKVWLKSGAYIIIEPTEAMTVIDVNSGKYDGKKKSEESYLRINKEAAQEIAKQLRLKNIAGICMVDFIDMETAESKAELMKCLNKAVSLDPVKTVVVDMTKLGLVEITRKRIRKPLSEQIKRIDT